MRVVLVSAALFGAACGGGGGGIDEDTFADGLSSRDGLTAEQARCVTGYVFDAYDEREITLLHDVGLRALPSPRWAEYGHAVIGCLYHDGPTGSAPP